MIFGAALKFDAKVLFCVGNEVVAKVLPSSESPDSEGKTTSTISLERARKLYGRRVSTDNQAVGKVFDIIGNADSPYVVIKLTKEIKGSIVNKIVKFS